MRSFQTPSLGILVPPVHHLYSDAIILDSISWYLCSPSAPLVFLRDETISSMGVFSNGVNDPKFFQFFFTQLCLEIPCCISCSSFLKVGYTLDFGSAKNTGAPEQKFPYQGGQNLECPSVIFFVSLFLRERAECTEQCVYTYINCRVEVGRSGRKFSHIYIEKKKTITQSREQFVCVSRKLL